MTSMKVFEFDVKVSGFFIDWFGRKYFITRFTFLVQLNRVIVGHKSIIF